MAGLEGRNLLPGVLCPVQDLQKIISAPQGCWKLAIVFVVVVANLFREVLEEKTP